MAIMLVIKHNSYRYPVVYQSLTQRHGDTVQKCDQAMKEAETYRQQYQITKDKMEHRTSEFHIVNSQYKVRIRLYLIGLI